LQEEIERQKNGGTPMSPTRSTFLSGDTKGASKDPKKVAKMINSVKDAS
jgi:hypothetical protein